MISMNAQKIAKGLPRIADLYQQVRARTLEIVAPLEIEDYVIQTAEFMSPPRWHIGHTSWFFETVLQKFQPGYRTYSEDFLYYFNSYYEGFGARIERLRSRVVCLSLVTKSVTEPGAVATGPLMK